jgi:uncharacterized membrane protein
MRLALKTLSYGVLHVGVATTVAYALTGNLVTALGIGLLEPVVQTGVFAVHEWLWERKPVAAPTTPSPVYD